MSADADGLLDREAFNAIAATRRATAERLVAESEASRRNERPTRGARQRQKDGPDGESGSIAGASGSGSSSPTSRTSDEPSDDSKARWRKPRHVRALAAQINEVATLVLNGAIDPDQARLYSSLTRNLAALISAETTRARFAKEPPDLALEEDE